QPPGRSYDDVVDVHTDLTAADVFRILGRCLVYIRPHWRLFALKFGLMLGSFAPLLVVPWPIKILVDHVVLQHPLAESTIRFPPFFEPFVTAVAGLDSSGLLLATLALLGGLVVLFGAGTGDPRGNLAFLAQGQDTATQSENLISAGWSMAGGAWGLADLLCNIRLVQRVTDSFRTHLFHRLIRLPMPVLDDQRIGDSIYRTMYDAPSIQGICFDITLMPVVSILGAAVSVYVMHYSFGHIIPELIWLAMATMPLALLFTAPLAGLARRASQASRSSGTATTNRIEENTANMVAVQSHGAEDRQREEFAGASATSFRRYRHVVAVGIAIDVASSLALLGVGVWTFLLVTEEIIGGKLLPGDFIVVLGLFFTVAGASITFGRLWVDFQNNAAGVRRVFFFIDLPGDGDETGSPSPKRRLREAITFDNVGLVYPDGRQALTGVSFEARVGQTVALVGPTGAGKTSLAYLVPGFLQPTSGRVLFDGVDIRDIDPAATRVQVSYFFQEHLLFSETVLDNLRLGRPEATEAELQQAARMGGAHEFIEALPDGYQTVLAGGGGRLSVGQKQRLSIARGLVRDTPVLILDEPTAALDPDTESALVDALNQMKQNRIVFLIAHRLSTVATADLVVFMDDGHIVESGSPAELMAKPDGAFRRFATP
ncbi:MAG: ABC transporter ATP-binding protein, partial [Gammaproteobacteria bacterium]|nr:ABC transporter ATP-binding protein [Gammaproteobacteria bacterium]